MGCKGCSYDLGSPVEAAQGLLRPVDLEVIRTDHEDFEYGADAGMMW